MILTKAFDKINKLKEPIRIVQGSSSASKTYSIVQKLILQSLYDDSKKVISIVTDTFPNLKRGAFQDFKEICEEMELGVEIPKQPGDVKINNYTYQFFSVDDEKKARGGRRDILFLNEANRLDWEIARQLIMRARQTIYIDYNPDRKFWAHDHYIDQNKGDFLIVTYKDNHMCPQFAIDEIESYKDTDPEWFKVYGLGLLGDIKGSLFAGLQTFKGEIKGTRVTATDPKDTGDDMWCSVELVIVGQIVYVDKVIYTNANPEVTVPRLGAMINEAQTDVNYVETNMGGSFLLAQVQSHTKRQILPIKNQANKLTRIINESRFIKKYFRFREDGDLEYKSFYEDVRYYTGDKKQKDDAPDALAIAAKVIQTLYYHIWYG